MKQTGFVLLFLLLPLALLSQLESIYIVKPTLAFRYPHQIELRVGGGGMQETQGTVSLNYERELFNYPWWMSTSLRLGGGWATAHHESGPFAMATMNVSFFSGANHLDVEAGYARIFWFDEGYRRNAGIPVIQIGYRYQPRYNYPWCFRINFGTWSYINVSVGYAFWKWFKKRPFFGVMPEE